MRRKLHTTLWLALALVGLSACTSVNELPMAPINPMPETTLNLPVYRLKIGDQLELRLPLNPELNEAVTVGPDGRISTTLATNIPAFGRSVDEVSADLSRAYAKELHNVKLALVLQSPAPSRVYVAGEVASPGELITSGPDLTLLQAIARAGGIKEDGKTGKVVIIRRGVGDKPSIFAANYGGLTDDLKATDDVRLAPFDIVFVPRTAIGEVYKAYHQYVQQFIAINWGFAYQVGSVTTIAGK